MRPTKGSRNDPLLLCDLPFKVPKPGRYWLDYGKGLVELPEAPEGSTLALEFALDERSVRNETTLCARPKGEESDARTQT